MTTGDGVAHTLLRKYVGYPDYYRMCGCECIDMEVSLDNTNRMFHLNLYELGRDDWVGAYEAPYGFCHGFLVCVGLWNEFEYVFYQIHEEIQNIERHRGSVLPMVLVGWTNTYGPQKVFTKEMVRIAKNLNCPYVEVVKDDACHNLAFAYRLLASLVDSLKKVVVEEPDTFPDDNGYSFCSIV